ncbi:MAG: hypothetical protein JWM83_2353 [Candidatus Angelobacter sp.]|nr:hypothetical protein [Candidatus Angelobacter sp.]
MLLTRQVVCRSILSMPFKRVPVFLALLSLAALVGAQTGSAKNLGCASATSHTEPAVHMENGSILYAELSKTIDAKKAKVGDPVNAVLSTDVLSHGKIIIRHDSKLIGHVSEVQPHTKETPESRLGIVFDRVILKSGEVSFQSLLLAIRPAEHPMVDVPRAPSPLSNSATQPMQTGHYPSPQGNSPPARINSSLDDGMKSHDRQIAKTGPTDIDGLSLSSPANGGAQTIVSTQRTVKLESGVKIELRVIGQ